MADGFEIVSYKRETGRKRISVFKQEVAEKTTQFHKSFPDIAEPHWLV